MVATETEKLVLVPLRHPVTGEADPEWWYAGSVDRVESGRVVDWKSCGDTQRFRTQKAVGFQPECYALALRELGYTIEEYEYRAIQTPGIKYCAKDKDAHAYEQRCYEWLKEDPTRTCEIVAPLEATSLRNAAWWLWTVKERIKTVRATELALTNESACYAFNTRCAYIELCKAAKNGDPIEPLIESSYEDRLIHEELELPDGVDPANILTYSAAALFSSCEQKHYWRNELALQLKGEETAPALYLGSALHKGLEHIDAGDIRAAFWEIELYAQQTPTLGGFDATRKAEALARARAMLRVAKERWCNAG